MFLLLRKVNYKEKGGNEISFQYGDIRGACGACAWN